MSNFSRKNLEPPHTVVSMAMVYYNDRIPSKINKRKKCIGLSLGEIRKKHIVPVDSHSIFLILLAIVCNHTGDEAH
jgi:hypothetical protein